MKIAVVGDNCIDWILPPIGHCLIGGNAVNVGVHLARLGAEVSYFGAVGKDGEGEAVAAALRRNSVDFTHLTRRDLPTAKTIISVDAVGDRHMDLEDFGACSGYSPGPTAVAELLDMEHVHIGWLNDGGRLRRTLVKNGVSVSQDLSVNARPDDLDSTGIAVAFASQPGTHAEAIEFAASLMRQGAHGVVVTRGQLGSSAFMTSGSREQKAFPIKPIDTTGAGDSYIAGFLYAHLSGASLEQATMMGAKLAAETCLHPGGFPQEPMPLPRVTPVSGERTGDAT